ncbi:DUF4105 domain-containing protein [Nitrosomonas marina]|uniref:Uncharacterized protein n=1 Tax=Nitrosomonas marina TaxID=917 RepID=A0A1H8B1A3_9PROT|nr:DUF4105 domain-containing protein [Nitrosomonas marina]SEM76690.1 protein of unknown function [Nitrosomonas marina]
MPLYLLAAGILAVCFCLFPDSAYSRNNHSNDYLTELQQQAKQLKLNEQRVWHLLLKYKPQLFGGVVSEADGMDFFNAPDGKTSPESELTATLASFFLSTEDLADNSEHPQCNFPARFKWLNQQLQFDTNRLQIQVCDRLERWINELDPVGVTLVFASYYLNNPASMFGHTLVRIDSRERQDDKKLTNYGANYAAVPDTDNPFLYAWRGLTGSFEGKFAIFPYYTKVQEYNNLESRDLWEYELNFTEAQLNTMLLHLWELGGTHFDYYYFQENCSYHVLSLFEIARPELHLKDQFIFSVIPADTVKIVVAQENLVKKVVYRPSIVSQLNQKRHQMTNAQRRIFRALVKEKLTPDAAEFKQLPDQTQALLLDAYMDLLQYQSMREQRAGEVKIPYPVLLARSRLDTDDAEHNSLFYFSSPPHLGHGADRIRIAAGHNDREPFIEFAYRPAYHDLMARDEGYDKDSEIIFMDFKLRYFFESQRVRLDQARLLSITALNPYDPQFVKPSWRFDFSIDTLREQDCGYCNTVSGSYGRGIAYRPDFFSPILLFSFLDLKADVSSHLKQNYRFGGNAELGAFYNFNHRLRIRLAGSYRVYFLGDKKRFFTTHVVTRYALTQNLDMRMKYNRYDHNNESIFAVNYYF